MGNVVKPSVARRNLEKKAYTKEGQCTLEWLYRRKLTADEETDFARLSEDKQIDELLYRFRIATKTNVVPWTSDEEVKAYDQKANIPVPVVCVTI